MKSIIFRFREFFLHLFITNNSEKNTGFATYYAIVKYDAAIEMSTLYPAHSEYSLDIMILPLGIMMTLLCHKINGKYVTSSYVYQL